eukprot:CAMPEP_0119533844 /NCGR_PEP_ID=MMETSP1344-20130328/47165_1 /TAXON_ID=236787 /ORGANISM="Florenciella parvula, Strain CCMP2471" /LENGTH=76 /DNA_ID=CAMNT_0007574881 /DNA_START=49 /DNA_END=274 /DNA_ORIENTATION=-
MLPNTRGGGRGGEVGGGGGGGGLAVVDVSPGICGLTLTLTLIITLTLTLILGCLTWHLSGGGNGRLQNVPPQRNEA